MVFSSTSNHNGIIQLIEKNTGLGLGTISDNSAPDYYLDYFTQLVNNWLHYTTHIIHRVSGEALYDDANHGNFNIETYDCTDDQQDHGLDSDISIIRQIEMHDADEDADEGWYTLDFQLSKDRASDRFGFDKGTPGEYWINGRSIIWDLPVDITEVDKYRITYDRHAHEFVTSDTTAEPGFDKQFHPILVYGPAMEWANIKGKQQVVDLCNKMLYGTSRDMPGLIKMLKRHYASQVNDFVPAVGRKEPSGGSWE